LPPTPRRPSPTGLAAFIASGTLAHNALTVVAVGSASAVAAYTAERRKRNRALGKVRMLTACESLVLVLGVLGFDSLPPAATASAAPGSAFSDKRRLPTLGITPGDFVHEYLRHLAPDDATAVCKLLRLVPAAGIPSADAAQAAFGTLIGILTAEAKEALNEAIHNPTLGEVQDLLKHIDDIGWHAAAVEFGWLPAEDQARAIANVKTFVAIIKHIFSPFMGTAQGPAAHPLGEWELVCRPVQRHWRNTGLGRRVVDPASEWEGGFLQVKRNEVFIKAMDDGVIPGKVEVEALKTDLEVMKQELNDLRGKADEVDDLRGRVTKMDAMQKEIDDMKGKLQEMDDMKKKLQEMDEIKRMMAAIMMQRTSRQGTTPSATRKT